MKQVCRGFCAVVGRRVQPRPNVRPDISCDSLRQRPEPRTLHQHR